jgi:hypothetical protein
MLHRYRIILYVSKRARSDTKPIPLCGMEALKQRVQIHRVRDWLPRPGKLFSFDERRYAQKYAHSLHSSTIQACSALW